MKKLILLGTLIVSGMMINNYSADAQSSQIDLQIKEFKASEITTPDGKPTIEVFALIVNSTSTPAENCAVEVLLKGKNSAGETEEGGYDEQFTKIEKGYRYLFYTVFDGVTYNGKVDLQLNVCPDASGEKNIKNNSKKLSLSVSEKPVTEGTNIDIALQEYKTLFVKNKTNTSSYWYSIKYKNSKSDAVIGHFSNDQVVNGIKIEVNAAGLPGKSFGVSTAYFEEKPFVEGKNLVKIILDRPNNQQETDEKNTYLFQINMRDGDITKMTKLKEDTPLLVQGLLNVNQNLITDQSQPESPNEQVLAIPILNVGENLPSSQSAPSELKLTLKLGNATFDQTYNILSFEKGTVSIFYFTNRFFTKNELSKTFGLTVSLDGKTIYSRNHKPTCSY